VTTIRILCDNSIARTDFLGEHGFAALIERPEGRFLFDTGQGFTLPHNAQQAGLTLQGLSAAILSHGHYDHTGGLGWVLTQTGPLRVVAHPALFDAHLALNPDDPGGATRVVGCPLSRAELEERGARFEWHATSAELAPGLWFLAGYPRQPSQTPQDPKLVLGAPSGNHLPDPIAEDAGLLLHTASGPVLVLGCAHGGLLNILDHLTADLGLDRLHAVLGGTHLMFYGTDQIRRVIARLEDMAVARVAVSHCTGSAAAMALARHFRDRFSFAAAGSVLQF
jgi:7,8-dihydropterin-6-yl-methyl-4-(beta-D-ribofuranosyl)aminobenzene 5'-phosphate synthase